MVELYGWVWFLVIHTPSNSCFSRFVEMLYEESWWQLCLFFQVLKGFEKTIKVIQFPSILQLCIDEGWYWCQRQETSISSRKKKQWSTHPSNSCKERVLDPLLKGSKDEQKGQILADAGLNHSMNATERWYSASSSLTDERIPWGSRVLCFLMMRKHIQYWVLTL